MVWVQNATPTTLTGYFGSGCAAGVRNGTSGVPHLPGWALLPVFKKSVFWETDADPGSTS
jgi:hypothetical protein